MRFRKGMVGISDTRDVPVLKLIRDARAISISQLTAELMLMNCESCARSARWRLHRLHEAGLIDRMNDAAFAEPVYIITQSGLGLLEIKGHVLLAIGSASETIVKPAEVFHMLELNSIRLEFRKAGLLHHWKTELEIISENLVGFGRSNKDYDAIVTLNFEGNRVKFALEYERTVKSAKRYREIVEAIRQDESIDLVVYLVANYELAYVLEQEFQPLKDKVAIGFAGIFKRLLIETQLLQMSDYRPFIEILRELPVEADDQISTN